jgi:hypothetical protein
MTDQPPPPAPPAKTPRPALTGRAVGLLALAAVIVPLVVVLCWVVGVLTAGPGGELAGFGPYFCRHGHCVGEANAVIRSSVNALLGMIPLAVAVGGVGFVIAVLARRRGFVTVLSILGYLIVLMVSVNTAAYSISGGNQIVGTIIIGVFAIGVPIGVVLLARAAISKPDDARLI